MDFTISCVFHPSIRCCPSASSLIPIWPRGYRCGQPDSWPLNRLIHTTRPARTEADGGNERSASLISDTAALAGPPSCNGRKTVQTDQQTMQMCESLWRDDQSTIVFGKYISPSIYSSSVKFWGTLLNFLYSMQLFPPKHIVLSTLPPLFDSGRYYFSRFYI